MLSPHMEAEHRLTIADALPRFSEDEKPDEDDGDEKAVAMALDSMWLDIKTHSKLNRTQRV